MSGPLTLHENEERHYHIRLMPCIITKRFDKVICMRLSEVQPVDENGQSFGPPLEVWGQFSADGLRSMLKDLEDAPDPVGLPSPDEIRHRNPYQWGVVFADGTEKNQYEGMTEMPFSEIHLPEVRQFWIYPRPGYEGLPRYGLIAGCGFCMVPPGSQEIEWLECPYPDWPFHWHYYRRNWIVFSSFGGVAECLPERVVQVLGWRVEDDGRDVIFEIGIEADGSWTVFKKEPWDHPGFTRPETEPESRQIIAEHGVHILDLVEVKSS